MTVTNHRFSGKQLIRMYDLPVRQARYHKEGTFFERLDLFPGALCDPEGYVIFESESEFENDSEISLGSKVNVHQEIRKHSRYKEFPKKSLTPQ